MPLLNHCHSHFILSLITVSNHFPFPIDKKDATIAPANTGVPSVDSYFQTARYADEALRQFINYLKRSGLYDHTIIIMYGDHYGISKDNNKEMEQILGKEITPFESTGLQRVPLFIRVPGIEGGVNHEYGGQIDVLPTLLHLLGIDTKKYVQFGTDLLSKQHDDLIPFRNGDFVSSKITSIAGKFYDSHNGNGIRSPNNYQRLRKISKSLNKNYHCPIRLLMKIYYVFTLQKVLSQWIEQNTSIMRYSNEKTNE